MIFERILGLKVNFAKSSVARIGVVDSEVSQYAQLLGCRVEEWPLKYLGMPLGGRHNFEVFWNLVVEKVNKKLACWKSHTFPWEGESF